MRLCCQTMDTKTHMIPKIIHYCWFGRSPMPELAIRCIESWHKYMPDYEYKLWNEDNFDVNSTPYTKEAYEARQFAFVSDVVRLKVLKQYGGIYFDVDFEVYKPFDNLLNYKAFAGFEGSKHNPVMMGVIASVAEGEWVSEQLGLYENRHFIVDGAPDLTTNVTFISRHMAQKGFTPNGKEQEYLDLHIFPVDYFCPRLTTGEYLWTENTYCQPISNESSWSKKTLKGKLFSILPSSLRIALIKTKRKIIG